jgi:hypothetical protein
VSSIDGGVGYPSTELSDGHVALTRKDELSIAAAGALGVYRLDGLVPTGLGVAVWEGELAK